MSHVMVARLARTGFGHVRQGWLTARKPSQSPGIPRKATLRASSLDPGRGASLLRAYPATAATTTARNTC